MLHAPRETCFLKMFTNTVKARPIAFVTVDRSTSSITKHFPSSKVALCWDAHSLCTETVTAHFEAAGAWDKCRQGHGRICIMRRCYLLSCCQQTESCNRKDSQKLAGYQNMTVKAPCIVVARFGYSYRVTNHCDGEKRLGGWLRNVTRLRG